MNPENTDNAIGSPSAKPARDTPITLASIKLWMQQDVSFQVARGWLVAASAAVLLLLVLAID